jgi:hypothetical protein
LGWPLGWPVGWPRGAFGVRRWGMSPTSWSARAEGCVQRLSGTPPPPGPQRGPHRPQRWAALATAADDWPFSLLHPPPPGPLPMRPAQGTTPPLSLGQRPALSTRSQETRGSVFRNPSAPSGNPGMAATVASRY